MSAASRPRWNDHVADRTTQIDHVLLRINKHPLEAEVRADIAIERAYLGDRRKS